ncbi:hypothetical protein D3C86_1308290 [compost metagenome]
MFHTADIHEGKYQTQTIIVGVVGRDHYVERVLIEGVWTHDPQHGDGVDQHLHGVEWCIVRPRIQFGWQCREDACGTVRDPIPLTEYVSHGLYVGLQCCDLSVVGAHPDLSHELCRLEGHADVVFANEGHLTNQTLRSRSQLLERLPTELGRVSRLLSLAEFAQEFCFDGVRESNEGVRQFF